jgi:tetratricopeptide (TPR) repeat protein
MNRRRRRPLKWGRIFFLSILIGGAIYINQVVVPTTPPLFIPTPTATRAPESFVSDAEDLLNDGKLSQAVQSYIQAIEADPKNIANYITLAKLQVYTGDYASAVTSAENALLLSPNNSMANAVRGWGLGFLGNYLEAEAAIKEAIDQDPNNGIAYAYYAEMLALQSAAGQDTLGSIDKAIQASQTAMALAPNSLETHRARGAVLEITGNYKEAIQEFEAALALNNNISDIHLALGRNYRYIQDYARAVEEFTKANALNPADPLPDTYISRTYATVGEFAKAIQYAQQATKDDPSDPFLHGNLGTMFYRNRQYQDAVTSLRLSVSGGTTEEGIIVEPLPLDYGRVAEYYFTYGLTLARQGQCGEALQISQLLVQGVPNDETSTYNAQEMVAICQEYLVNGTPTPLPTLAEIEVPTPQPTTAPTEGQS